MAKNTNKEYCKIDAIVTVDSKGQIVLPKDMREQANIEPNDKLALICMERSDAICCIVMMKAEALSESVKCILGPIFNNALCQARGEA